MNKSLTSRIVALVCLGLFTLQSFAGTVTGQVQNAAAGPVRNGTFSFTLTAPATVAGTATVVTSSVPCYTDGNGNVAGEPDPLLAPVLSVNLASGTLPAATYFVKIWYFDGTGNSFVSPEASISLVSIGTLNVLSPVKQPLNASGYRIGISTVSGSETIQGSVTGVPGVWGNFSQSVPLTVPAAAAPVSNTTVCTLRFNDELTPSFTCYDVGLTSSTGSNIPGYPAYWYLNGGSAGTINVGSGTPQSNVCQGQGVVYPQAIVSLPPFNATQTVNGGLNITGNVSVGGTLTADRFWKTCDASFYSGADDGAKITAALADSNCSLVSALNLVSLTGASPVSIPNNKHVILPCGLYVGATTAFSIGNFAGLQGTGENCTIISTNSGTANIVDIPSPNQWWYLSDFSIRSEVARTAGAGIGCHGGNGIAERIAVYPVFDGVWCDTASVSNNNTFRHVQFTNGTGSPSAGSGGTWHCGVRNGGAAAGTISGNTYDDVVIPMFTAFTDAGFCIQDGSDTTTIAHSQAVANIGGVDSVAVHIETVNGGLAPTITKFISDEFEGGLTKNAVVVDANVVAGLEFTNVNTNSSLRGYLINTGSSIHILGGQIYSNQQEGIRAVAFSDLQVIGARFGNNSQQTTLTFDDIFIAANQNQFKIIGNTFSDFSNTGKFARFNMRVDPGTSTFYDISDNLFLPTGSGALSDGGTGLAKHVCNLGSACNLGNSSLQQMGATSGTVTVQPAATAGTPTMTWSTVTGVVGSVGTGTVTTNGTLIAAGACQAQTGITIAGSTTTDAVTANINAAIPATWQTGIRWFAEVQSNGTCAPILCNPTAAGITPAATSLRCTVIHTQ